VVVLFRQGKVKATVGGGRHVNEASWIVVESLL